MENLTRRGFLFGFGATIAIIPVANLMPVRNRLIRTFNVQKDGTFTEVGSKDARVYEIKIEWDKQNGIMIPYTVVKEAG